MVKKVFVFALTVLLAVLMCAFACAYTNPLTVQKDASDISAGDPFIMKYNGTYYMYPSNYSGYAWKSDDLVNWVCIGRPFQGDHTLNLYAPEVFYSNGYFYCISCSEGTTNYTLKSKSPEGPFTAVSGDLGMSIDSSFFRDDDGTVYLTNAGWKKLELYKLYGSMTSAAHICSIPVNISNGWTEGPTIFKRDDIYYLTYTGNHVLDYSYRVEWAYSAQGVTEGWTEPEGNLLLANANSGLRGTGHNSIVIGPDLDTYYIVYHHITAEGSPDRRVDIDRIVWNGQKPSITATDYEVSNPAMPRFEERYTDAALSNWSVSGTLTPAEKNLALLSGKMISGPKTDSVYTAEINLVPSGATVYFGYEDAGNCAALTFTGKTMTLSFFKNGAPDSQISSSLPADTNLSALQCIKIRQTADALEIFFDGARKIKTLPFGAGAVGIEGENLTVGYIAFSDVALGSGDFSAPKYLPSTIEAALADNGQDLDVAEVGGALKAFAAVLSGENSALYTVYSPADYNYSLSLFAKSAEGAAISLKIDGKPVLSGLYIAKSDEYAYTNIRDISIPAGTHTLEICVLDGRLELYEIVADIYEAAAEASHPLNMLPLDFVIASGKVSVSDGMLKLYKNFMYDNNYYAAVSKNFLLSDYSASITINPAEADKAGLILRSQCCTAPSKTSVSNLEMFRQEWYQRSYFVCVENGCVVLHKYDFGDTVLVSHPVSNMSESVVLRADAVGNTIDVYLDGEKLFSYTDNSFPYLNGRLGFMAVGGYALFGNLEVSPVAVENTYIKEDGTLFKSSEHMIIKSDTLPAKRVLVITASIIAAVCVAASVIIIIKRKKSKLK